MDYRALAELLNDIAPHLSLNILFLAAIVVCVATIVQLNIGLGFGMTAGPLMALLDTSLVPMTVLLPNQRRRQSHRWGQKPIPTTLLYGRRM